MHLAALPSVAVTPPCRLKQKHIPRDRVLSPASVESDIPSADGSVSSRWSTRYSSRRGGWGGGVRFVNLAALFLPAWAKTAAGRCVIIAPPLSA